MDVLQKNPRWHPSPCGNFVLSIKQLLFNCHATVMSNRNGMQFWAENGTKQVLCRKCIQPENRKLQVNPAPRVIGTVTSDVLLTQATFSLQAKNWQDSATTSTKKWTTTDFDLHYIRACWVPTFRSCKYCWSPSLHTKGRTRKGEPESPAATQGALSGGSSKQLLSNSNLQPTVTRAAPACTNIVARIQCGAFLQDGDQRCGAFDV